MGEDPTIYNEREDDLRDDGDGDDRPQKKEFLKRKSLKIAPVLAVQPKKYNYYVDNFDENRRKERSTFQTPAPERSIHSTTGFSKNDDVQIYSKAPPSHLENTPNHNRAVSPLDGGDRDRNSESAADRQKGNNRKKPFLTRGSGKAGGKQGHQNPVPQQKQKGQK